MYVCTRLKNPTQRGRSYRGPAPRQLAVLQPDFRVPVPVQSPQVLYMAVLTTLINLETGWCEHVFQKLDDGANDASAASHAAIPERIRPSDKCSVG